MARREEGVRGQHSSFNRTKIGSKKKRGRGGGGGGGMDATQHWDTTNVGCNLGR
jgi:hypothetical protein